MNISYLFFFPKDYIIPSCSVRSDRLIKSTDYARVNYLHHRGLQRSLFYFRLRLKFGVYTEDNGSTLVGTVGYPVPRITTQAR